MSTATLKFLSILLLSVGLIAGLPVASPDEPDALLPKERVAGFASGEWKESLTHQPTPAPSATLAVRAPQATLSIFDNAQWEEERRQFDSSAPRSTSLLFSHGQWENSGETHERRQPSNTSTPIFAQDQWEDLRKRHSSSRDQVGPFLRGDQRNELSPREDISTVSGPVIFAKVQWDDE